MTDSDAARHLCWAAADALDEFESVAINTGVDIQIQKNGTICGATAAAQLGHWDAAVDALDR